MCVFRSSTHVRCGRILAAISHLKVLHATLLHLFASNVVGAMSAPQRYGICGAVCCLNLFSVSVCMVFESRASEANTCELLVCIGHRRSWTPRALPSVLWAPCCSVHTRVTLLGAHESTVSCVPVFCVLPAFRGCVCSLVTVCCSNLQFILAVPEDGTQMCKS